MGDFLASYYPWIKSLHVISVIAWMAGLFYMPRLFVYHVEGLKKQGVAVGSEMDLLFQHQERLLLKAIINPASVATWIKAASVLAMTWFHHWLGWRRKEFIAGTNSRTGRQYRLMNEVPTVLMILIVISVIVKY